MNKDPKRSSDSAISEFLGIVAHRIHTPVAAIKWQVEALLDGAMGPLSEEQKESLRGVMQSAENLNDFSRSVLYVYELEKDMPLLQDKEILVSEVLDRVKKSLVPLLKEKRGRISVDAHSREISIVTDPEIAFTILRTFIENALHYSPEDSEIHVEAKKSAEGTTITVIDAGFGISSDLLPSIGSKFFRTAEARRSFTNGAGLNLYIAMNLAERTRGKITFKSEEGKGSRFSWFLPMKERRKEPWQQG